MPVYLATELSSPYKGGEILEKVKWWCLLTYAVIPNISELLLGLGGFATKSSSSIFDNLNPFKTVNSYPVIRTILLTP
jgi:hypothetical protein